MSQKRLVADPNVGVRELQAVFVNFLKTQPTKDLLAVLGPSKSCKRVDWKSAPLAELLGCRAVSDLYQGLFKCCKNGVLPRAKMKNSLWKVQAEFCRMNLTSVHDEDYMDSLDDRVRVLASQYRSLKQDIDKYSRLLRKASCAEKQAIDDALALLDLDGTLPVEQQASFLADKQEVLAMVPYVHNAVPEAPGHDHKQEKARSIFQRLLNRQTSSPTKSAKEKVLDQDVRQHIPQKRELLRTESEPDSVFLERMLGSSPEEAQKKKHRSSSKVQSDSLQDLSSLDLSVHEQGLLKEALEDRVAVGKRPAKKAKAKKKVAPKAKSVQNKKEPKKQVKQKTGHKCSLRRRIRDSAYHSAKRAARVGGFSPNSARRKACEAAAEAARQFDEDQKDVD